MTTDQVIDHATTDRESFAGVLRFYELAKRQEWQVADLPWVELPPIPEGRGSAQRRARRRDMWRSVLTQQLQADMLACDMSSQLLNIAPDPEAKLYYSTMVQDDLCNRLTTDDGIHHGAGMAYERVLLQSASNATKRKLVDAANRLLPIFVKHALWR